MFETLGRLIDSTQATIGVIGLGYVGLPLCENMHSGGFSVLGFDVDETKIDCLERGESYLGHLEEISELEPPASYSCYQAKVHSVLWKDVCFRLPKAEIHDRL